MSIEWVTPVTQILNNNHSKVPETRPQPSKILLSKKRLVSTLLLSNMGRWWGLQWSVSSIAQKWQQRICAEDGKLYLFNIKHGFL